jgi:urease accessory protein
VTVASLLLLADARFPDGSHAHSYGIEAAVADARVRTPDDLYAYIEARLWSSGRTDAAAAALAASGSVPLEQVDAALTLRTPSEVARRTSRTLGRSLVRTATRLWPDAPIALIDGRPPLQPVALGAVATRAGCTPGEAALCVTHGLAGTLATAALRLLGMDPFSISVVLADLRPAVAEVASSVEHLDDCSQMPHASTPFGELDPQHQAILDTRLFGS